MQPVTQLIGGVALSVDTARHKIKDELGSFARRSTILYAWARQMPFAAGI
jgi:hypothetical protein